MKRFRLRVVTFNVHDYYPFARHGVRMRETGRLLARVDPDLVSLQEALIERDRRRMLRQLSGTRLKHTVYFRSGVLGSGLMILSAFPIKRTAFRRFSRPGKWYKPWHGDFYGGKGVALARIAHPQCREPLAFYNAHTQARYGKGPDEYLQVRTSQLHELAAFVRETRPASSPAIVAGDLNCPPRSEQLAILARAELERLMTIDTRVDHVLGASGGGVQLTVERTERIGGVVLKDGAYLALSDHDLLVAEIWVSSARRPAS